MSLRWRCLSEMGYMVLWGEGGEGEGGCNEIAMSELVG